MRLESLAQFTQYLTSMPDPQKVSSALARGPLSIFGARALRIMIALDDDRLVLVSDHGHSEEESSRYREISLHLDVPLTHSYREGRILRMDARQAVVDVPAYAMDKRLWDEMLTRLGATTMISAPIVSDGAAIGAYSMLVADLRAWEDVDDAYLTVISATLGLWMSHSHNGISESLDAPHPTLDASLSLTKRQVTILHLIDHGRSNDAIGAALGYSVSTVKAEMQAIHRTLRTHDRSSAVARAYELGILPLQPELRPISTQVDAGGVRNSS